MGERDGEALSLDEMEAVARGAADRDWLAEGCAATGVPDSSCWGTDGGCWVANIDYENGPNDVRCPYKCGARYTFKSSKGYWTTDGDLFTICQCRECGRTFYLDRQNRTWIDY